DQPLLLARQRDEDERRVELDAALREGAGQLHRERGAAAIVVHAGRRVVPAAPVEAAATELAAADAGHGVVVAGDVDAARAAAGQDRDDVAELDLGGDPALRQHVVAIERRL